jgi:hypothetical protein
VSNLKVWTNGTDTVVASDLDEVQQIVEKQHGTTFAAEGWSQDEWWAEDDDQPLTIHNVDGHDTVETKTRREWASEGRGFLCSTEY